MSKEIRLTLSQINKMKHAVGLDLIRYMPNDSKYSAYRNFFASQKKDADLEQLVAIGYASSNYVQWADEWIYYITTSGIDYLEKLLNLKIKVNE